MIGKILGSGQLGKLASFVSPAFFDVMPAAALWKRARKLFAASRDREAFRHAVAARSAALATRMPQLVLGSVGTGDVQTSPAPLDASERAKLIAELYFEQLFDVGGTLLDLRASAFDAKTNPLRWSPAPWIADWSPDFIGPLRRIYTGFYEHNDDVFHAGLAALSISHSADLFREHFGGTQSEVRFKTADFIETFHKVFLRCKESGTALHPDFLALGIYLAALYDHLEELDVPVDVAAAFARVQASLKAADTDPSTINSVSTHA